ncbi:radical SAM family heme chaperone HemW [Vagococcus carniphilus]|uniref:radical SAM family heme chaperone HemW n=1 Tax=Vagococcus carniphilus TaxID=218144 RepID=UPI0028927447|nr:radical SAM family heme chaperone HemW [Vagococcus carniphilus]MDT2829495.1 radical SAM family heme chaperone HemW [Vagococcus carniphilus]MDT2838954.1 radical SAM family heme chaperone HemW [Vagococcus carniphilus]MDT2853012.1 radical SAM family heme chaperone HemW [Vagococcus carniphilus]
MTSAYIHIPFCEHICFYCDFNKVFIEGQPVDDYIESLIKEIRLTKAKFPSDNTETIYIGGGTPTSLSASQLDVLLKGVREELPFKDGDEFTVEANPGDLTLEKLKVLQNYGVNRVSMGVQSFNDRLLKKIGRKHSAKDVYDTMKIFEAANFDNISIDLIFALPNQTMEDFEDTLNQALSLDLPHYSMYSLILENKTMFYNWARQGRLHLPGIDVEGDMFELAIDKMTKAGRHQYEVSNFAKPGKESQHNLIYWNNEHYYGLGAGASGYLGNIRYKNHGPIQHYLKPLEKDELPTITIEELSIENQMEEEMFLGLRKTEGVSIKKFEQKFNRSLDSVYGKTIQQLIEDKLIKKENDYVSLTSKGLILGNEVFKEFLIN